MYYLQVDIVTEHILPVKHVSMLHVNVRVSMAVWFKSMTSNHLPLTAVGLNPIKDFSYEEATQLAYRMSNVLLRCPLMPKIIHRGAPEVFLGHLRSSSTSESWKVSI